MGFNGTCEKQNICCIAALSATERMHDGCHVVGVNFSINPPGNNILSSACLTGGVVFSQVIYG